VFCNRSHQHAKLPPARRIDHSTQQNRRLGTAERAGKMAAQAAGLRIASWGCTIAQAPACANLRQKPTTVHNGIERRRIKLRCNKMDNRRGLDGAVPTPVARAAVASAGRAMRGGRPTRSPAGLTHRGLSRRPRHAGGDRRNQPVPAPPAPSRRLQGAEGVSLDRRDADRANRKIVSPRAAGGWVVFSSHTATSS
jgi:hypothetical protein